MTITRSVITGAQLRTPLPNTPVPCNGCRECCRGDTIALKPELGDNPDHYLWHPESNPVTGNIDKVLDRKPNGDCIYLDDNGCTIHERAPTVCREFDCRWMFKVLTRQQRREWVKNGAIKKSVFDAARERLHTLEP